MDPYGWTSPAEKSNNQQGIQGGRTEYRQRLGGHIAEVPDFWRSINFLSYAVKRRPLVGNPELLVWVKIAPSMSRPPTTGTELSVI